MSDYYPLYFSWSDWIGITNHINMPTKLQETENTTDTVFSKHKVSEIWSKKGWEVSALIDVLADYNKVRWVPNFNIWLRSDIDFTRFDISYIFGNVANSISADNIKQISYIIESNAKNRLSQFNNSKPLYMDTEVDIYIIHKERLNVSEARKCEQGQKKYENTNQPDIPDLDSRIKYLVHRVESLNKDSIRANLKPDKRLAGIDIDAKRKTENFLKRILRRIFY